MQEADKNLDSFEQNKLILVDEFSAKPIATPQKILFAKRFSV